MRGIVCQGILVLYSFVSVLLVPVDTGFVVAFLAVVLLVSVAFLQVSEERKAGVMMIFLVGACFFPKLLIFSPVVVYTMTDEVRPSRRDMSCGMPCGYTMTDEVRPSRRDMSCGMPCGYTMTDEVRLFRREFGRYLPGCLVLGLCAWFYGKDEPGVFVLIVSGCLFGVLLSYQAGENRKLEEMFKRTRDDSRELNLLLEEKNQSLLKRQDDEVYTARLKERNRIAREIHDNVGHMLSRAILMTGAMKAVNQDENVEGMISGLEDTLHAAMTSVRESVHDLHDDSVNLGETLSHLAEDFTFCEAVLTYDMGYGLPRELKYSFLAIVKEGLNNVAKHSDASRVEIVAREHPGLYQLIIKDNGRGKTENIFSDEERGIGLRNMKERVRALGGNVQFSDRKGFRVYVTVPKKGEAV